MNRFAKAIVALAPLGLLAACGESVDPLKVGSKDFIESEVVGYMLADLAEDAGIPVERRIPYGDSAEAFEAIKEGRIDLYLDYNGTGLAYTGQTPSQDGDASLAKVRELYGPLGLNWLDRLGFANDYAIVMRPEAADAQGIGTISDLSRIQGLTLAVDTTFAERPLDGLGPMARRYALDLGDPLAYDVAEGGKDKIMEALLDGRAQAAELYTTDAEIDAYGLKVLKDDLKFFPVYEGAPVVRQDALARFPNLSAAIGRLAGKLSTGEMRRLNAAVTLGGQSAETVALAFLTDKGLLKAPGDGAAGRAPGETVPMALETDDSLSGPAGRAVRAARTAFKDAQLRLDRTPDPLEAVRDGKARLGVTSADDFFTARDGKPAPRGGVEAVGVVGYKLVHLIAEKDGPRGLEGIKRLGVGEAGSSSDRTARLLLAGLGLDGTVEVVPQAQDLAGRAEALAKGDIDALLVMAPQGESDVAGIMGNGRRLLGVEAWTQSPAALRFSFLRPARLAPQTYPGMGDAVDTLSSQMVLIGPVSREGEIGERGPQTTGTKPAQVLPDETITGLREAFGRMELVDPALPQAAMLTTKLHEEATSLVSSPWASLANLFVIVMMVFLFYLLIAEPRVRLQRDVIRGERT